MAMVRVPLGRGSEQTIAPDGEYELVVRKFEKKESKAGNDMWVATVGFTEGDYELITHYFNMVISSDPDNIVAMKMRDLRRFLVLFEVPHEVEEDGSAMFDSEDVPGCTAKCRVTVNSIDTDSGPRDINRLRLPRVKED